MRTRVLTFMSICAVIGAATVFIANWLRLRETIAATAETRPRQNTVIIFEPRDYNHKPFPLTEDIDIGAKLTRGRWIVVLYRYGCMSCVRELPKYSDLANRLRNTGSDIHIALIEMPPYAPAARQQVHPDSRCYSGKLSNSKTWFIPTPVAFILNDGIVVHYAEGSSNHAAVAERR